MFVLHLMAVSETKIVYCHSPTNASLSKATSESTQE